MAAEDASRRGCRGKPLSAVPVQSEGHAEGGRRGGGGGGWGGGGRVCVGGLAVLRRTSPPTSTAAQEDGCRGRLLGGGQPCLPSQSNWYFLSGEGGGWRVRCGLACPPPHSPPPTSTAAQEDGSTGRFLGAGQPCLRSQFNWHLPSGEGGWWRVRYALACPPRKFTPHERPPPLTPPLSAGLPAGHLPIGKSPSPLFLCGQGRRRPPRGHPQR